MGDLSDRLQNGPSSSGQAEGCAEGCVPEGLPGQMQAMVAGSGPACGPTAVVLTLQAHQQTAHVPKPGPAQQPSTRLLDRSTLGVCATFTVQVSVLEGSNGSPVQQPEQLSKPLYTASTGGMVGFWLHCSLQPGINASCRGSLHSHLCNARLLTKGAHSTAFSGWQEATAGRGQQAQSIMGWAAYS